MMSIRQSARFNIFRKFTKARLAKRFCRKVSVVAANDVIADVTEQPKKDSVDDGFCGEPFADNGELLSSLSPLLFSMKLFGLYFHREHRHRRRTDDPEWNPTTATDTSSTKLRVYATIVLILAWLNAIRFTSVFTRSDQFGALLLMKISFLAWFVLIAMMYTAYYVASHSGTLLKVLTTIRVTKDCVRGAHLAAIGVTAMCWTSTLIDACAGAYLVFNGDIYDYDFLFAPFVTYVKLPADKCRIVKAVCYIWYTLIFPSVFFSQGMTVVLVYIFCSQYKKLKKNFCRAIGEQGEFNGDLSAFRRRQELMRVTIRYRRIMSRNIQRHCCVITFGELFTPHAFV